MTCDSRSSPTGRESRSTALDLRPETAIPQRHWEAGKCSGSTANSAGQEAGRICRPGGEQQGPSCWSSWRRAHAAGEALGDVALLVQFRFHPGSPEHQTCMKNALRLRETGREFIWIYPDQAPRGTDRPTRHFDLLLLPSLSEVQPMVVAEALSCGVPVVATRSTRFFDEMDRFGFALRNSWRSSSGATRGGSPGHRRAAGRRRPRARIARDLIDAISRIPRFDDARRLGPVQEADLAGFSDATMLQRYLRIYDEIGCRFWRSSCAAGERTTIGAGMTGRAPQAGTVAKAGAPPMLAVSVPGLSGVAAAAVPHVRRNGLRLSGHMTTAYTVAVDHFPALPAGEQQNCRHQRQDHAPRLSSASDPGD